LPYFCVSQLWESCNYFCLSGNLLLALVSTVKLGFGSFSRLLLFWKGVSSSKRGWSLTTTGPSLYTGGWLEREFTKCPSPLHTPPHSISAARKTSCKYLYLGFGSGKLLLTLASTVNLGFGSPWELYFRSFLDFRVFRNVDFSSMRGGVTTTIHSASRCLSE
jgi:hypothetical protein